MSTQAADLPVPGPEAQARYFRILGDATRLRILHALLGREHTVSELVNLVGAPQSRVSNHLACLKWCGFAEARREGRRVVYKVRDSRVRELLSTVEGISSEHCDRLVSCRRIGPEWI